MEAATPEGVFQRRLGPPPPVYSVEFLQFIVNQRLTQREAEIVHYYDRMNPCDMVVADDLMLDLSQSLKRSEPGADKAPCITPGGQLWLRRRRRWLTAYEASMCQGYDPPPRMKLRQFSHRQIIDLIGNSFHCDSCVVSLAAALACAPSMQTAKQAPLDDNTTVKVGQAS